MAGPEGEGTPSPYPTPDVNDTADADGNLENPVEGPDGGYSEEQAGLDPDDKAPTDAPPSNDPPLPDTDKGITG